MKGVAGLLAALCVALPAQAQDRWPALYDVVGVHESDVLNVRADPDAASEIIGHLSPDSANVEIIKQNDAGTWGLLNIGEATGWAALAYLERQPGQILQGLVDPRQCFGTEPFWSLSVTEQAQVTWSEPGQENVWGTIPGRYKSGNTRGTEGFTLTLSNDVRGYAVVRGETCSDGMSDRLFGLAIDVHMIDKGRVSLLSGCCSIAPSADNP